MTRFRWLRDLVAIAAVTLLLAELGLRALPWVVGDPLKSLIEEAGRIPLSNVRVYSGFSGGTRRLLPPTQAADVLVVGDSVPFGTYVREADTFPALLEKDTGKKVINLAVGSQAPPQYNRMVEIGLQRYSPKLLLYCIFANDFDYPSAPKEDSELFLPELNTAERAAMLVKRLTNLSRLYQLRKLMQQPSVGFASVPWKDGDLSFMFAPAAYWDRLVGWDTPAVKEAVEINAGLAGAAKRLADGKASAFAAVLLPSKEMVYGPIAGDRIYRDAHYETYRQLTARLEASGIRTVDMTGELQKAAHTRQKLFHTIDGHLNENGHRLIAAALGSAIRSAF
jgi:hypothetical protein